MPLLIDGHNLIPHVPGINLRDPEDEAKLVALLQDYCRARQKTLEVFFDRAPVGQAGVRSFGRVKARYVRVGMTADEGIMRRLQQLGKKARNYQVVSADRQVQQAARAAHAGVISSAAFAACLQALGDEEESLDPRNRLLSSDEVEEWARLFERGGRDQD